MLKSPISVKLEKRAGEIDWIVVQRLSKKVTDEEGGRYRTEMQCLQVTCGELTEMARNSSSLEPLSKISHVSEL